MTVEQVCTAVLRDRLFFAHSGGGVTLSGGEPMMQPDFSLSVLRFLKSAGIHTALETCGHFDEQWIVPLLECTDLFLFDYKETDPLLHKQWTGVLPTRILHTLHRLSSSGANIILRCPIIPTLNDRADHFAGIAHTAQSLHLAQVELMPYHSIGLDKAKQIGFEQRKDIPLPTENDKQQWLRAVKDNGFQHVTVSR